MKLLKSLPRQFQSPQHARFLRATAPGCVAGGKPVTIKAGDYVTFPAKVRTRSALSPHDISMANYCGIKMHGDVKPSAILFVWVVSLRHPKPFHVLGLKVVWVLRMPSCADELHLGHPGAREEALQGVHVNGFFRVEGDYMCLNDAGPVLREVGNSSFAQWLGRGCELIMS